MFLAPVAVPHIQDKPGKGRGQGSRSSPHARPLLRTFVPPWGGMCPASGGMDRSPLFLLRWATSSPVLLTMSPHPCPDSLTYRGGSAGDTRPGPWVCLLRLGRDGVFPV